MKDTGNYIDIIYIPIYIYSYSVVFSIIYMYVYVYTSNTMAEYGIVWLHNTNSLLYSYGAEI